MNVENIVDIAWKGQQSGKLAPDLPGRGETTVS